MIKLSVLGTLEVATTDGSRAGDVLIHAKRVALLTYLALAEPRGFHRRDRLYALLWPESDTERARNSLRQAVHQLRRALGQDVIVNRGDEELAVAPDLVECDAHLLERAAAEGRHADVVGAYRGELLPGFHVPEARDFGDWLDQERERLGEIAAKSAWTLAEDFARSGKAAEAARVGRTAAAWRPFSESTQRRLIELLDRLGDTAGALRVYDSFAARVRAELEAEPSEATAALVRRMRERTPVLPPPPEWAVPAGPAAVATRKRRWAPGLFYTAGILTVLAIAMWQGGRLAAPRVDAHRVSVFPFVVRGTAELHYLGDGLVDLLSAQLEGAGDLHTIDPHSAIAALRTRRGSTAPELADYAARARELGAGRFVIGDLVEAGGKVQLTATLYDVERARPMTTGSTTGTSADLFAMVDGLTGRLLAGLTQGRDTTITRLAARTTQSLPALKAFLVGEQALRAGLDAQAATAFREAVALDSTFALAQYRLALTATWVPVPQVPDPAVVAAKAARHAQRLTPLVRDLISAYQAYKEVRIEDAERVYAAITTSHPDNLEAWFMLAETRFHYNPLRGRSPLVSRPAFERVLQLDATNAHAVIHLARLAAAEGRDAELDSLASAYGAQYPGADRTLEMQALRAYVRDDSTEQAAVVAAARDADDFLSSSLLFGAVLLANNPAAARDLTPLLLPTPNETFARKTSRRLVADVDLAAGRWGRELATQLLGSRMEADWVRESEAVMLADPAFRAAPARIAAVRDSIAARKRYPALLPTTASPDAPGVGALTRLYLLGLLSVRMSDTLAALRYASELASMDSAGAAGTHLARAVRAEVARTRGDLQGALRELELVALDFGLGFLQRPAHWGVHERFLRAEVLHALGRDQEALDVYESLLAFYDVAYIPLAQLRQGEIHARLGHRERAAFHYDRFIRMWKDCDPELRPLLEQATAARVRLRR